MRDFLIELVAIVALPLALVSCCSSPAPYSPNIDEAFVQAVAMQWEFTESTVKSAEKTTGKPSAETSGNHLPDITKMVEATDKRPIAESKATDGDNEYVPIDSLNYEDLLSSDEIIRIYAENEAEISKIWASLDGQEYCRMKDAVMIWLVTKAVKNPAAGDSKTSYPPDNKQSAAAEGESTPAVSKGSPPPAAASTRPLFYEIILHTGKDCAPCDRLKHELKVRGYPFTEHLVSRGTVPTAFIDGEEFVGDAIYNRLKIVKLNRKDSP